MLTGFLWATLLWSAVQPKVLLTNLIPEKYTENQHLVRIVEKQKYHFKPDQTQTIYFGNRLLSEMQSATETSVSIHDIYNTIVKKSTVVIPQYHIYHPFHYQFIYTRYAQKLPYNEYCLLEKAISDIVDSYMHDSSPTRFVLVFTDPTWFLDESLASYLDSELDRVVFLDLDHPDLKNLFVETKHIYKIFIWDRHNHSFL
jgi:hypothetical protein